MRSRRLPMIQRLCCLCALALTTTAVRADTPAFDYSGYFAIIPSSNITGGTHHRQIATRTGTYRIARQSRAQPGVGIDAGLSGTLHVQTGAAARMSLRVDLNTQRFERPQDATSQAQLSLHYERAFAGGAWALGPYLRAGWLAARRDEAAAGLRAQLTYRPTARDHLAVMAQAETRSYAISTAHTGTLARLRGSWARQLTPALGLQIGGTLTQKTARQRYQSYDAGRAFVQLRHRWAGGLQGNMDASWELQRYHATFPLITAARRDHITVLSVGAQHAGWHWNGLSPRLQCSAVLRSSNVAIFDSRSRECRIEITQKF